MHKKIFTVASVILSLFLIAGCKDNDSISPTSMESAFANDAMSKNLSAPETEGIGFGHYAGPLGFVTVVLDLTPEQKQQIKNIQDKYRKTHGNRRAFKGLSRKEYAAKRTERRDSLTNQIKEVLTSEQLANFEEVRKKLDAGEVPDVLVKNIVDRMTNLLNLTSEQQEQATTIVRETIEKRFENRVKLRQKTNGKSRMNRRFGFHKRKGIKRHGAGIFVPNKLMTILSDEQKKIIIQIKKTRREKRKEHRQTMRSKIIERRLVALTRKLDLTSGQQKQIKTILADIQNTLKPDCDNPQTCRKMQQAKTEETNKKIMGILTEEQQEKFAKLLEKRKNMRSKGYGRKRFRGRQ